MDNIVFAPLVLVINMFIFPVTDITLVYALDSCRCDTFPFITCSFMCFDSFKSKSAN